VNIDPSELGGNAVASLIAAITIAGTVVAVGWRSLRSFFAAQATMAGSLNDTANVVRDTHDLIVSDLQRRIERLTAEVRECHQDRAEQDRRIAALEAQVGPSV